MKGEGGGLIVSDVGAATRTGGGLAEVDEQGNARFFANKARCDIVFVIDTTGSMDDKIEGLISTSQVFVDRLAARGIDWQVAIVGFGDLTVPGDTIQATSLLKASSILTFVVSEPEQCYRKMATSTGGEWFQICSGADFLSILDRLIANVTTVVSEVAQIAGGDVQEYLRLKGT